MNLSDEFNEERLQCIEADILKPGHMPCESCRDIVRQLVAAVRSELGKEGRDVRLRVAEDMARQRGAAYDELRLLIDDAGFTVASGKLEPKTHDIAFPSMKKIPTSSTTVSVPPVHGENFVPPIMNANDKHARRLRAARLVELLQDMVIRGDTSTHDKVNRVEAALEEEFSHGLHMGIRKAVPYTTDSGDGQAARRIVEGRAFTDETIGLETLRQSPRGFETELEKHRATMEALLVRGMQPSTVHSLLDAVWFLLAVAHQPVPGGVVEVGGSSPEQNFYAVAQDGPSVEVPRGICGRLDHEHGPNSRMCTLAPDHTVPHYFVPVTPNDVARYGVK